MQKYTGLIILAGAFVGGSCLTIGIFMFFFTEKMLDLTALMEKRIGAYWIPTEKTYFLYQIVGIFFLSFGAGLIGYLWYKP